jgi:4-hydroxy-4-methyl-2-oxoglutarate aldolase
MAVLDDIDAATIHEAQGREGALPSSITAAGPGFRVCGPAFTVDCPPEDNLWIHRAVYRAQPGDVLVVDVRGGTQFGYWGEILSEAAQARGLGGLVITGGVRDSDRLAEVGFPIFSTGRCLRGTVKDPHAHGALQTELTIGVVVVTPGDLIVGDADGVVAVPASKVATVAQAARERLEKEAEVIARLRAGERTLDIYELPEAP